MSVPFIGSLKGSKLKQECHQAWLATGCFILLKGQKQLIRVCVFRMEDKIKFFFFFFALSA